MNIGPINNKNIKPKQPDGVDLEVLYNYASYVKSVYDYSLQFLLDEFYSVFGKRGTFKSADLKKEKRAREKLEEDDVKTPDNLLDIVRGTVYFSSVEELLDFIKFTQSFEFKKKNFYKMEDNVVKKLITDVPVVNSFVRNSFNFDLNDYVKNKYLFLKKPSNPNKRNYMDFKFYICIPVPSVINDLSGDTFMFTEVIATLDCFKNVSDKTHNLYEAKRSFKYSPDDDLSEDTFLTAMDALIRSMYIDAIEEYNNSHSLGIKIHPYNDNKDLRLKILNDLGSSITLTKAICSARIDEGR